MPLRARGTIIDLSVPSADSIENVLVKDVIGQKDDTHLGDSLYAHAHIIEEHVHKEQLVYPTLANSIQVAGGAGAWELGNLVTIMPANTVAADMRFDIHWIIICALSANDEYELILYANTTQIGRLTFTRTDKKDVTDGVPFQCPILAPSVRIRGRLASSSGGDTGNFKIMYHEY